MILRAPIFALLLALTAACSPHSFSRGGYQHEQFPVYVEPAEDGRLVSRDWLVDEWSLDRNERPVRRARLPYGSHRSDLVLRHRTNDGRMWLDAFAIPVAERDQALPVLVDRIMSEVNREGSIKVRGQGTAMRVVAMDDIAIDGHPARLVIVESGDGEGTARGAIVILRANFVERTTRAERLVPVLLVAGYAAAGAYFEAGLGDFGSFLASLDIAPSESRARED